jgi:hypothetical protein
MAHLLIVNILLPTAFKHPYLDLLALLNDFWEHSLPELYRLLVLSDPFSFALGVQQLLMSILYLALLIEFPDVGVARVLSLSSSSF